MSDSKSTRRWKPTRLWDQESRSREAAGRRNWPELCPGKAAAEKGAGVPDSVASPAEHRASRVDHGGDGAGGQRLKKKGLTLDYTPGCSFWKGAK